MDNFILYDDICKNENSIIYKGRRKGSINFVAIHCIEKVLRPEITNLVRLTYEMSHKNTVKFYEWYETSNHLWLVVELCTAGSLELLLQQDGCLPESSIRQFGIDLCEGLFHIHSLNLLFCDLIPRKIMIDGNGTLKFSDFGLSKLEGEDLETIFQETFDSTSSQWSQSASTNSPPKSYKKPFGDLKYMAPEVISGEDNSKESDIWSLGVLLYQMYTGSMPFVSENTEQLKQMILNKELPNPKGNKLSTKPSSEFISLLKGILEKNPTKRLNWRQILTHPFWEKKLEHLLPPLTSRKSILINGKDHVEDIALEEELDEVDDNTMNYSHLSMDRPRTAAASTILEKQPEINVSFSISSRLPTSPQSTMHTRNPVQCQESDEQSGASTLVSQHEEQDDKFASRNEYRRLFFVPSELNVSQIVDNPKIQKPSYLKFEPKALPLMNPKLHKTASFLQISKDEFDKNIEIIKANTNVPADKSAGAIKIKLHLMNYIGTLSLESSKFADTFIQIELYNDLLAIIKNGHNLEMKMKAARVFAIIFNKAKKLDLNKELTDVLQGLLDVIAANRKDAKFKQALLPALGELLYFISCQETLIGKSIDSWSIPSSAYVIIIRSIGDDLTTNHLICKIIENIASTNSHAIQKFLSNQSEVVNAIWLCYSHAANNEQLRIVSLKALCMLASHSISIFLTLLEKVGVDPILDCLSTNNCHIQQSMLTMIAMLVNESSLKNIPEKKLIAKLVNIYDSTNVICRAKAYLLTFVMIKQQNDLLLPFSQSKLINSMERDYRKSFAIKEENDYIHKMIDMLMGIVTTIGLTVLDDTIISLEAVYGRKNPSPTQCKQLKKTIPNASILKTLISSQTFRTKLIDAQFFEKFSKMIHFSKPINNGELNLDLICGPGVMAEYMESIISILEKTVQNKDYLKNFSNLILKFVVPSLIENIDSSNSDLRVESIKVFSEISCFYLNKQESDVADDVRKKMKECIEGSFIDIFDKLLTQPEPLPFFSLTIMHSAINFDITLVSTLKIRNILPGLFRLLQIYKNKFASTLLIKLLNVINLWSSTIDPFDLYDYNIIDCIKGMMLEISKLKKYDDKIINEILIELLKITDNLLKYVSEFVKKALQAKKTAGPNDTLAQQAEKLLHSNKPLSNCSQFLIFLIPSEDVDINELSSKILWMIMQLFGSDSKDLLNQENINILLDAIINSNAKRQKILLRIVKRIITADKQNLETFKAIGTNFILNMKVLKNAANAEANVGLSSMIDEILKLV